MEKMKKIDASNWPTSCWICKKSIPAGQGHFRDLYDLHCEVQLCDECNAKEEAKESAKKKGE